ncbi:hypothetical protein [Scytonema sp. PRP1]|uniref:hypothetical protein n=1 Tax=Scytonema sp. PRP1 TaxID=3120513 RepID=UPI002FD4505F
MFQLAITVASVTKYKVTVKAQAHIRPAGELRIVQAATEGRADIISKEETVLQFFLRKARLIADL